MQTVLVVVGLIGFLCVVLYISRILDHTEEKNQTPVKIPQTVAPLPVKKHSSALQKFPDTIAFLDVETTGLHSRDRIVTLAVALLDTCEIQEGKAQISFIHRIYNPGIHCQPDAERIHGHSDWTLRQQLFFIDEAKEVSEFISKAGMVCCHNAEFDLNFVNREFVHAGIPAIKVPIYCTMKRYRQQYAGSASLANLGAQLGLQRQTNMHGALEDVFLTMNVFLVLNKVSLRISIPDVDKLGFQNLREVPPQPMGTLPPRKRRPKTPSCLFTSPAPSESQPPPVAP